MQVDTEAGAAEVVFDVDPQMLADPYVNTDLGVRFRPPVGWEPLDEALTAAVASSLAERQRDDAISQEIVDFFLSTETFSFASIMVVSEPDSPVVERERYASAYAEAAYAEAVEAAGSGDDPVAARAEYTVNGIAVTQFRRLADDRIVFTLLFEATDGRLLQLDYSIPVEHYQEEIVKLESSIGSLSRP